VPGGVESSWIADLYEIYLRLAGASDGFNTRPPDSDIPLVGRALMPPSRERDSPGKVVNLVDGFSWTVAPPSAPGATHDKRTGRTAAGPTTGSRHRSGARASGEKCRWSFRAAACASSVRCAAWREMRKRRASSATLRSWSMPAPAPAAVDFRGDRRARSIRHSATVSPYAPLRPRRAVRRARAARSSALVNSSASRGHVLRIE